ncbi:hypothetical protein TcYC6_0001550 [Trypanosoma cruzi]|nr:hypothetical protein TcYC6_0001550 [Trypanosoma cruzi]
MGYKASPEILQIITSAIAVVTAVAHRLWAAPPLVRIDVWIGNIRIAGSKSDATLWEAQVLLNADSCHASMGEERESGATHYTFLGLQFDHTHRAVFLSDEFVRSVRAMSALNSLTIAEMEVMASRFLYAAAIFGTRLCAYYFFIKAVRRRLSAVNQGIVLETSPANLPPAAVGLGERLRHIIENNRRRIIESTEKASAAIIADASLHGWRAVFIPDSGDVKIAGGKVEEEAFSYHAGRGARGTLGLIDLFRHLAIHHGRLGGQHFAARSGEERQIKIARHDVGAATDTWVFGLSRNKGILCLRTVCGKPRRRHITRSCVYTSGLGEGVELAKGSGGVLWLEDLKVCQLVSNNI